MQYLVVEGKHHVEDGKVVFCGIIAPAIDSAVRITSQFVAIKNKRVCSVRSKIRCYAPRVVHAFYSREKEYQSDDLSYKVLKGHERVLIVSTPESEERYASVTAFTGDICAIFSEYQHVLNIEDENSGVQHEFPKGTDLKTYFEGLKAALFNGESFELDGFKIEVL